MDRRVELVPLVCMQCGTPIPAEPDQVAWACGQCGQGMLLDNNQGLVGLKISYSADIPAGGSGKPYWVVEGKVMLNRETYRGDNNRESQQFWSQPRRFFVPAFACPLDTLVQLGAAYLAKSPEYQKGTPAPFDPVVLSMEDVRYALEFIVVGIEAGRKDIMKGVKFSLELTQPELWVLP